MGSSQIYLELLRYFEHFHFFKTLKAFKKEIPKGEFSNQENTLSPQQLIESIVSYRQSLNDKQEKKKRRFRCKVEKSVLTKLQNDSDKALGIKSTQSDSFAMKNGDTQRPLHKSDVALENEKHKEPKHKKKKLKRIQETKQSTHVSPTSEPNSTLLFIDAAAVNNSPHMTNDIPDSSFVSRPLKVSRSVSGSPLRRLNVRKSLESITDPRLLNRSYAVNREDSFTAKAARDLQCVRGKDFRREMNKKKRASWRSFGVIEERINSIQFISD